MSDVEGSPQKKVKTKEYDNLMVQPLSAALGVLPRFADSLPAGCNIDSIEVALNDEGEILFTDPATGKPPVFNLGGEVFSYLRMPPTGTAM